MQNQGEFAAACLPEERQRLILELLAREGRVVAVELAQQFCTSEDTIRRDLRELAAAGLCHRVYGGALPLSPDQASLSERMNVEPTRKQALGQALAKLLPAGQVIFVDAGSTNLATLQALPEGHALTIITNSPTLAAEVLSRDSMQLILIGGQVDKRTGAAFGARALRDVADLRPDVYLLGTCTLNVDAGIGVFGFDEAEFKRTLIAQSSRIITAATSDKLNLRAPFSVAPVQVLDDLVLETDAPAEQLAALRQAGVRIHQSGAVS